MRSMGQDRAPGPDGMSTGFYLQHWPTVRRDVFDMATHFFRNFELPQFINNTNIVLVPKKDYPTGVNDYRPIALCNVAYKCISKILALRLRNLLPCIISPAQTAFVKGRQIAENTAVAREIVHSMSKKRGKKGFMMIKLDMEKAYDKMSWSFILEVVRNMNFDDTFIKLLMAKTEEGKIAGFKFTRNGPAITHLMFAEDVILFGKASVKEAKNFLNCIEEIAFIQILVKIQRPPISCGKASDVIPKTIVRKVDKELRDFWWGDSETRRSCHMIAWSSLCQPKLRAGLGFRRLETINSAFLLKWAWKALTDNSSIWGRAIQTKYLMNGNFIDAVSNSKDSSFWKAILRTRSLLADHVCRKIGNGKETSIWFDPWVPSANRCPTPLMDATNGVAWVNQFMDDNLRWNEEMIRRWFAREDATAILNIQLPEEDTKDDWLWLGDSSGEFTIRSACRIVNGGGSCTIAKAIWFNSSLGIRVDRVSIGDWKQWQEWFLDDCNRPPNISFEDILIAALVLAIFAKRDIASDGDCLITATIVRNDQGTIVAIKSENRHITNPLIGEAYAACIAAELMVERKIEHVVFQCDNINVVNAFSMETERGINFNLVHLRRRFHKFCRNFKNWEIGHVSRKCNFMAHNIAKW
uniref:Reverse transcriptase domain-containing protein n=1 Tax=Cannabis sativa TaxID=3483 RepID=A0A803QBW0_CANSA